MRPQEGGFEMHPRGKAPRGEADQTGAQRCGLKPQVADFAAIAFRSKRQRLRGNGYACDDDRFVTCSKSVTHGLSGNR